MSTPESETLTAYMTRIADDTKAGRIKWVKSNPTTFVYRKAAAQLSLQRIVQHRTISTTQGLKRASVTNYIFQAIEVPRGNVKLIINTAEKYSELRPLLDSLFETINIDVDRDGLDFLKKVIEQE
jgi:hypothetical protein